ncbi:MAG: hypothetical protein JSV22_14085 [Bacteroidales bacterium]|nr:MAG: hypothetical protein JSV22_14085 [Bacteroidales bacterium]
MNKNLHKCLLLIMLIIILNGNYTNTFGIQIFNRVNYLKEKLYITTDRNLYFTGENILFKIICTESNYNIPVNISSLVYFELLDSDNKPVSRHKIEIKEGFGSGCIALPDIIATGNYRIRAYTNWMKNFGDNSFFIKNLIIINPDKEVVFRIPESETLKTLSVDFFPESGRLIKDLDNHIVLRVLNQYNEGINARAHLYKDSVILKEFEIIKGIGSFNLKPCNTKNYYAKVFVNDSVSKSFIIPEAYKYGAIMNIEDFSQKTVSLKVSSNLHDERTENLSFILNVEKNSIVYYSSSIFLKDTFLITDIPASYIPEGISYINLYNENNELHCTCPVYKRPKETIDIEIVTDKNEYKKREKVNLVIKTRTGNSPVSANLAIKVKKSGDPFEGNGINFQNKFILNNIALEDIFNYYSNPQNSFDYSDINNALIACIQYKDSLSEVSGIKYLPEIKGQIISGKVINKENSQPAWNQLVYLSFTGAHAQVLATRTNKTGEFSFSLNNRYSNNDIVIQVNDKEGKYILLMNDQYSNNFKLHYGNNLLKHEFKEYMVQNMINYQVTKAYNPDNILYDDTSYNKPGDFYGEPDEQILISDFVKLPVMEEVLIELLKWIYISTKKGVKNILIIGKNDNKIIGDSPLYIIDGVPVFDPSIILSMDPSEVEIIKVVSSKYFLGDLVFDGILDIQTKDNKFENIRKLKTGIQFKFESAIRPGVFVSPQYESEIHLKSRIPDLRNTVYWNPEIITDTKGISNLSFYTSDDTGIFDIIIEGISYNGQTGYKKLQIEVTN